MSTVTVALAAQADARADSGDDAETLFNHHAARLRAAVGRNVLTSPANVEDACAFAWLQLCRHRPEYGSAFNWLRRTATREAVKLDRRTRSALQLDGTDAAAPADARTDPAERLDLIAAGEAIRAAGLREDEARLVGLRALGYTYADCAELTGSSRRSVERRLLRANRKLRATRSVQAEAGR